MNKIDLQLIRKPLLVSAALATVGILLLSMALWRYATAAQAQADEKLRRVETIRAVERMRADRLQTRIYNGVYKKLVALGAIGEFDKTTAIDQFETAIKGQPAAVRSFTLSPRSPTSAGLSNDFGRYSLGRYELKFQAQPLHEVQLIELSDSIRTSLGGLSTLEGCQIRRPDEAMGGVVGDRLGAQSSAQSSAQGLLPKLDATCTISWYAFSETAEVSTQSGAAPALN